MKTILILAAVVPAWSFAADCKSYLQGYNEWEMKVKGEFVTKVSYFDIPEWDPNSGFEGVVLTAAQAQNVKKPVLEIEFRDRRKTKMKSESFNAVRPFELDPNLMHFSDFKPREFFTFSKPGTFEVRLKDGDQLLCRETHRYGLGH